MRPAATAGEAWGQGWRSRGQGWYLYFDQTLQGCYWIQKGVKENLLNLFLGPVIPYGPPFLPSANVERCRTRPTDRRGEVGVRVSAPLRRAAAPYGVAYGWEKHLKRQFACLFD